MGVTAVDYVGSVSVAPAASSAPVAPVAPIAPIVRLGYGTQAGAQGGAQGGAGRAQGGVQGGVQAGQPTDRGALPCTAREAAARGKQPRPRGVTGGVSGGVSDNMPVMFNPQLVTTQVIVPDQTHVEAPAFGAHATPASMQSPAGSAAQASTVTLLGTVTLPGMVTQASSAERARPATPAPQLAPTSTAKPARPAAQPGPGDPIRQIADRLAAVSDRLLAVSHYLADIAAVLDKGPGGYYADVLLQKTTSADRSGTCTAGGAPVVGGAAGAAAVPQDIDISWALPLLVSSLVKASPPTDPAGDDTLIPAILKLLAKEDM